MSNILRDHINLQQVSSHTYTASWHRDWTVGPSLYGGYIAAVVQHAAQTHFTTTLTAQNQPDILTLHLDFLLACALQPMALTVLDLKIGKITSTIQLQISQNDTLKVIATATFINFTHSVGPSARSDWTFHPPPPPVPNFAKVLAHKPDANWLPAILDGEILPFGRRHLALSPRGGFPTAGICDAWYTALEGGNMDTTYLTMMTDCIPSMSDTLLHNNGTYDAHNIFAAIEAWAETHPGVPTPLTNSLKEAAKAAIFNMTVTLDIEFKRKLSEGGLEWVFSRAATRTLRDGRMDLDVTLCDSNMEVLCLARQTILALDGKRKFAGGRKEKKMSSL